MLNPSPMRTFILVADGARASLFFRSIRSPELRKMEGWKNDAGRILDQPDEIEQWHRAFAKKMADVLRQRFSGYDQLTLIAPPKVLADLRLELHATVAEKVVSELAEDFTALSIEELAEKLGDFKESP